MVGGDFARSPRMQYHATSLCESGRFREVRCVGLDEGNRCAEHLTRQANVRWLLLNNKSRSAAAARGGWLVRTVRKVASYTTSFFWCLWRATAPLDGAGETRVVMLMQTPPAVPFLVLAHAVVIARRMQRVVYPSRKAWSSVALVIDFHNFGYTLLEVDRRPAPVVLLYRAMETLFGIADAHVTVSRAMQARLSGSDGVVPRILAVPAAAITVLYDCAPDFFQPLKPGSRHAALRTITEKEPTLQLPSWFASADEPAVPTLAIVSSTSWTADDDYELVVNALKAIDERIRRADGGKGAAMRVWLLVTGKGESRARFEAQVTAANYSEAVSVSTHYFQSFLAYATVLSTFDVGLCVHRSSSGLDLPMKCVDMFGAGLPVAALEYPALPELVSIETGWAFNDDADLAQMLWGMLTSATERERKAAAVRAQRDRHVWATNWKEHFQPVIERLLV
jgi:beta-1,4-mannosyltransferase